MPYSKLFYCKNSRRYSEKKNKVKNDGSAFWIRSNIFRHFSGCRRSILISEIIIRFVFPLAFQCRIPNYSTAKTCENIAKRKRKMNVRLFFIFWIRSNIFLNFLGCRRPIFKCFYIIRFVCPLAFQCRTVKLPNFGLCCNFGQNIVNLYDFF